jgi:lipooligosaccharide transport system permease protein
MTAASALGPDTRRPTASAWSVVEYRAVQAKQSWRTVTVVGIVTPLLYLLALGVGLGTVVDAHSHRLGVDYLQFVAPGLLTAAAVQLGASEASFPVLGGFKWQRIFHGMSATPLSPRQICDGQLLWIGIRLALNSAVYAAIVAAVGGVHRPLGLLAVPVATLTGLAFAATVVAFAACIEHEGGAFNVLFRFVVTPMFLFSGTFYPITEIPGWGRWLAYVSPLWHGTAVSRAAALGGMSGAAAVAHLAFLAGWLAVGVVVARWRFQVRLSR